jgi:hypothetical protein
MKHRLALFSGIIAAGAGYAQQVSAGIEGGFPIQTPLNTTKVMPFAVGPTAEVRLFWGISLQTGVLYRRVGDAQSSLFFNTIDNGAIVSSDRLRGWALDIPILAKYRFLGEGRAFRPFLAVGPTIRRTSIRDTFTTSVQGTTMPPPPFYLANYDHHNIEWNVDPTVAAGVDIRTGRFHVEPEVRYSYWQSGNSGPLRNNQVEFMFRFRRDLSGTSR